MEPDCHPFPLNVTRAALESSLTLSRVSHFVPRAVEHSTILISLLRAEKRIPRSIESLPTMLAPTGFSLRQPLSSSLVP